MLHLVTSKPDQQIQVQTCLHVVSLICPFIGTIFS